MLQIICTEDGSSTILNQELGETYHSIKGAIQESRHVFIQQGLKYFLEKNNCAEMRILEIGMGTGLNVFLTLLYSLENKVSVNYTALEPYPLEPELVRGLNYEEVIESKLEKNILYKIAASEWETGIYLKDNFTLYKHKTRLQNFNSNKVFDLIYYDAFAPSKLAEMWELDCFRKLYNNLCNGGILVSYCASGQFKRNLSASGFVVETLPGPPGKREMCRGIK